MTAVSNKSVILFTDFKTITMKNLCRDGAVNAGHSGREQCSGWTAVDATRVGIWLPALPVSSRVNQTSNRDAA